MAPSLSQPATRWIESPEMRSPVTQSKPTTSRQMVDLTIASVSRGPLGVQGWNHAGDAILFSFMPARMLGIVFWADPCDAVCFVPQECCTNMLRTISVRVEQYNFLAMNDIRDYAGTIKALPTINMLGVSLSFHDYCQCFSLVVVFMLLSHSLLPGPLFALFFLSAVEVNWSCFWSKTTVQQAATLVSWGFGSCYDKPWR